VGAEGFAEGFNVRSWFAGHEDAAAEAALLANKRKNFRSNFFKVLPSDSLAHRKGAHRNG
jgi:hypothetical protein